MLIFFEDFMAACKFGGGKRRIDHIEAKETLAFLMLKFETNRTNSQGITIKQDITDGAIAKASLLVSNMKDFAFESRVKGMDAKLFEELETFIAEQQLPSTYHRLPYCMFKEFNDLKIHVDNLNKVRRTIESAFVAPHTKEFYDDNSGVLRHKLFINQVQKRTNAKSYSLMT